MHHANHVGSLLRPAELRAAWRDHRDGAIGSEELVAAQDRAIRDVVAMQQEVGLTCVTDGEFRRVSYWNRFVDAVDGLTVGDARFSFMDEFGGRLPFTAPHVSGPVRRSRSICGDEVDFLRSVTSREVKIALPSPSTMQFWSGPVDGVYGSNDGLFAALTEIYRAEIGDLAARGADMIQLDEVALAMLCDPVARDTVRIAGETPIRLVDDYVAAVRGVLEEAPREITTALHLCRGNYKGHWMATGGYEPVAERLFGVGVEVLFLEFDSERAGGFEPLRFVPDGTGVVLGLVSSKTPALESRDTLLARIDDAARFLPIERLGISPQCGFASTIGGNPVTAEDQRRKLELIVSVSAEVWGRS